MKFKHSKNCSRNYLLPSRCSNISNDRFIFFKRLPIIDGDILSEEDSNNSALFSTVECITSTKLFDAPFLPLYQNSAKIYSKLRNK